MEQGAPERRTERAVTFYFSSRGRDFRHTQVGGSHDVVVGKAVPRAEKQRGLEQGRWISGHSLPRRKCTSLGLPVFTMGMLLRSSKPREEETGKKVCLRLFRWELVHPVDHQHRISQPTLGCQPGCLQAHLQVEREASRRRGRQWGTGGCSGSQASTPRLQELKNYPD